jgi:hypothetical protein
MDNDFLNNGTQIQLSVPVRNRMAQALYFHEVLQVQRNNVLPEPLLLKQL